MTDNRPEAVRRTERLRERVEFLRKRIAWLGDGDASGRAAAEVSALEWALAELEELKRLRLEQLSVADPPEER